MFLHVWLGNQEIGEALLMLINPGSCNAVHRKLLNIWTHHEVIVYLPTVTHYDGQLSNGPKYHLGWDTQQIVLSILLCGALETPSDGPTDN